MGDSTAQLITGNQAIAMAALRAGCSFVAARSVGSHVELLAELRKPALGGGATVLRTADELSAISGCIDASAVGAPSMTAVSSPRLGLCVEKIGVAQMNEVPLVIIHSQSMASSGPLDEGADAELDVGLVRHVGFASVPVIVFATTDVESCYRLTYRAFALAERFRMPVVLLTSRKTAEAQEPVNLDGITLEPVPERIVASSGTLNTEARIARLLQKLAKNAGEIEDVRADADPDAETLLLSYGMADAPARQAVARVREAGARVSHLTVHSLWPVPMEALRRAVTPSVRRVLMPELNTGLYAAELARHLKGVHIESIARYDGLAIDAGVIARRITDWPCG